MRHQLSCLSDVSFGQHLFPDGGPASLLNILDCAPRQPYESAEIPISIRHERPVDVPTDGGSGADDLGAYRRAAVERRSRGQPGHFHAELIGQLPHDSPLRTERAHARGRSTRRTWRVLNDLNVKYAET